MKSICKLFVLCFFTIIIIYPIILKSQNLENILFNNIKEKKFQIKGFEDYLYDLSRNAILDNRRGVEESFKLVGDAFEGSFINPYKKEYILIISLGKGQYCSFFGHANNGGNTTLVFTFDENYNQIGEIGFQDSQTKFVQSIDIDNDGLHELILESSYGTQGYDWEWWMIFKKDFNEPKLKLTKYQSGEASSTSGEMTRLSSTYRIEDGKFIVDSRLDYLYRDKNDNSLETLRSENRIDVFESNSEGIIHLPGDNNVNWDENNDPF